MEKMIFEAIRNAGKVVEEWIETAESSGREIPKPRGRLVFARGEAPGNRLQRMASPEPQDAEMQTVEEHLNPRKRFSPACHLLLLTGLCTRSHREKISANSARGHKNPAHRRTDDEFQSEGCPDEAEIGGV